MSHVSPKFAAGKYAWGNCDVCAIRCRLTELKPTTRLGRLTGLLACPTCWDNDHPQNFLPRYVRNDAQALRNPRPDTGKDASRRLFPPGNWIHGRPPSDDRVEASELEIRAEHLRQHTLFLREEEVQRKRQRSF
jgi:hypothetical protein